MPLEETDMRGEMKGDQDGGNDMKGELKATFVRQQRHPTFALVLFLPMALSRRVPRS